jgi:head-tail adaptor
MPIQYTADGEPWIDPAKLRVPITFLEETTTQDASGSAVAWLAGNPPDVTRAEIVPVRGLDVLKAGQDVSQVQIIATIRYAAPGRNAQNRFQDLRGNIYVIKAVEDVLPGRLVYQVLTCLLIGANS